jgi:hypothetical protein
MSIVNWAKILKVILSVAYLINIGGPPKEKKSSQWKKTWWNRSGASGFVSNFSRESKQNDNLYLLDAQSGLY